MDKGSDWGVPIDKDVSQEIDALIARGIVALTDDTFPTKFENFTEHEIRLYKRKYCYSFTINGNVVKYFHQDKFYGWRELETIAFCGSESLTFENVVGEYGTEVGQIPPEYKFIKCTEVDQKTKEKVIAFIQLSDDGVCWALDNLPLNPDVEAIKQNVSNLPKDIQFRSIAYNEYGCGALGYGNNDVQFYWAYPGQDFNILPREGYTLDSPRNRGYSVLGYDYSIFYEEHYERNGPVIINRKRATSLVDNVNMTRTI
jgi:hypothetical protein